MTPKDLYSKKFIDKINTLSKKNSNRIFIILGQAELITTDNKEEYFADLDTFKINGNETIFNKDWFTKVFTILNLSKDLHILSYIQFSYLIHYIDPSFFIDRVIILKDNLRQLFPITKDEYLEKGEEENIEIRPEKLPIYQAEQVAINGKYYYSVKTPIKSFISIDVFEEKKELKKSSDSDIKCIDITSDPYSIDIFFNECLEQKTPVNRVLVKLHKKQPLNPAITIILKELNHFLSHFDGELLFLDETSITQEYKISETTVDLLHQFWGKTSNFRDISVYKNPDTGNEISKISQGLIVDTIIKEYKNSLQGKPCRDLFLTAPTGAGKSLLFQLPAFYISTKGDVTIVISPLIALMKDQVNAIITELPV
ncbi:DEAD/DEAH box helicase [Anaerophaga thermohalophila]|uniref:DEAD/DEAH box helicase n=1 Tax=Anaerophaga thermohalophila TaxID=177400 RepID=UPI0002F4181F|nr:DEAD/DEAH box helicase [Anaerophaga thermohalophila]